MIIMLKKKKKKIVPGCLGPKRRISTSHPVLSSLHSEELWRDDRCLYSPRETETRNESGRCLCACVCVCLYLHQ